MGLSLDAKAAVAMFTLPRNDGYFDPGFAAYLNELCRRRPVAMLAFAPKAAGTFFRAAVIAATGGQLVRSVHAQGGRDGAPYLPTFVAYYNGGPPASTLVTHIHMQALPANRFFLEAFDIRPVIMIRSVPDMLVSYWDMLDEDPVDPNNWLNCMLPSNYPSMSRQKKADFFIDAIAPWYASYYATWMDYSAQSPDRVCALDYREFRAGPVAALETALRHMGLERPADVCERAIEEVTREKAQHRFNRGEEGRGRARFNARQLGRLERLLSYYPILAGHIDELMPV